MGVTSQRRVCRHVHAARKGRARKSRDQWGNFTRPRGTTGRAYLPQPGVDLLQHLCAWAKLALAQRVERSFNRVEMRVQVLGLCIDIKQSSDDLSLRGVLLEEVHRCQPVVRVIFGVELAQGEL